MSDSNDELMMETMYWWGIPTLFRCEHNKDISNCDIALVGRASQYGKWNNGERSTLRPKSCSPCICWTEKSAFRF